MGVVGERVLDLDYGEDSAAEAVIERRRTATGDSSRFRTAETEPFDRDMMNLMIAAPRSFDRLVAIQRELIVQTLDGKNSAR